MSEDTFQRWFSRSRLVEVGEERVVLGVPNAIYQVWIESNHLGQLRSALHLATGKVMEVEFRCMPELEFMGDGGDEIGDEIEDGEGAAGGIDQELVVAAAEGVPAWVGSVANPAALGGVVTGAVRRRPAGEEAGERRKLVKAMGEADLQERHSFKNFVRGENCAFAAAAALAAAKRPGKIYNPLFLHGKTGLGKTHLTQAIGQAIIAEGGRRRVRYVTAETFINGFIDALQQGTLTAFRKTYRELDVLLLDDVQLLAGKERSQEEFFHTFNHLVNGGCQIVLTSDCAPSAIPTLQERLVSRFQWGLTALLEVPDVETRTAILRKKTENLAVSISDDIINFIAENIRTNVRRLEGALMTVATHISLDDQSRIRVEDVEVLLKEMLAEERIGPVSISRIQKVVAEKWDIRLADMTSRRRPNSIAIPRQIAMYLSRRLTELSYEVIGDAFGGRDHGTVMHAYRKMAARVQNEDDFRRLVQKVEEEIKTVND